MDSSAVAGNWLEFTPEMAKRPIHFSMSMNGEPVQKGVTSDMLFSFEKIITNISQYFSLNIGDLIYTGTPAV